MFYISVILVSSAILLFYIKYFKAFVKQKFFGTRDHPVEIKLRKDLIRVLLDNLENLESETLSIVSAFISPVGSRYDIQSFWDKWETYFLTQFIEFKVCRGCSLKESCHVIKMNYFLVESKMFIVFKSFGYSRYIELAHLFYVLDRSEKTNLFLSI